MKLKTSALIGPALDWAVAKADARTQVVVRNGHLGIPGWAGGDYNGHSTFESYSPSHFWSQSGPIIERERIVLVLQTDWSNKPKGWAAGYSVDYTKLVGGPTSLIAAMRCFVASRLGDEVDVPDDLA